MAGKWIVFEGLDGAGTTTQTQLLAEYLRRRLSSPEEVFQTAEPTCGLIGLTLKAVLRGEIAFDRTTLALAFSADRSDHLFRPDGVVARLEQGHWVVMDRYLYSTLAYQDGLDRGWLLQIGSKFPRPDLLVFLGTPVEVCLERLSARGAESDLFEKEDSLRRIETSYRWVLEVEAFKTSLLVLDGRLPAEELNRKVVERVCEWKLK